jgi:hypothetical protein
MADARDPGAGEVPGWQRASGMVVLVLSFALAGASLVAGAPPATWIRGWVTRVGGDDDLRATVVLTIAAILLPAFGLWLAVVRLARGRAASRKVVDDVGRNVRDGVRHVASPARRVWDALRRR